MYFLKSKLKQDLRFEETKILDFKKNMLFCFPAFQVGI